MKQILTTKLIRSKETLNVRVLLDSKSDDIYYTAKEAKCELSFDETHKIANRLGIDGAFHFKTPEQFQALIKEHGIT